MPQFEAGERFEMSENDPDYPAMLLASYMFGEPITSRVSEPHSQSRRPQLWRIPRITVPAEGDSALLSATVS